MGRKRKVRHRVNVDRQVWEQITRRRTREVNFSHLVSTLLVSYVASSAESDGKAGHKVSVDITVDDSLWEKAIKMAHNQGLSLSHVLRELLHSYVIQ